MLMRLGKLSEALADIAERLQRMGTTGERLWSAELHASRHSAVAAK